MALWVVGLLAILIGSFAFDAHLEARLTSYYKKRTRAWTLAQSGTEVARLVLTRRDQIKDAAAEATAEEAEDEWFAPARRLKQGGSAEVEVETEGGTLKIAISPEPARRNINGLGDPNSEGGRLQIAEQLERIFEVGGIPEDRWPELIDSFIDWLDTDDDPQVYGAETEDTYASRDPPYRARNGPIDTVEELLQIKGFERAFVFGGPLGEPDDEDPVIARGIQDLLTTYGDAQGRVNVNAADARVLMTLGEEIDEVAAAAIIEERSQAPGGEKGEWSPFLNADDFMRRMRISDPAIRSFVSVDPADYFRIVATGISGGVRRQVWCIVKYGNGKLTILRWREDEA